MKPNIKQIIDTAYDKDSKSQINLMISEKVIKDLQSFENLTEIDKSKLVNYLLSEFF